MLLALLLVELTFRWGDYKDKTHSPYMKCAGAAP